MGYALWCDHGKHAFGSTERHHSMTVRSTDEDGNSYSEEKTVCAEHMAQVRQAMLSSGEK